MIVLFLRVHWMAGEPSQYIKGCSDVQETLPIQNATTDKQKKIEGK